MLLRFRRPAPEARAFHGTLSRVARAPVTGTGTPLPRKLGIRPDSRIAFVGAPDGFDKTLGDLPERVDARTTARGPLDLIVFFTTSAAELRRRFDKLAAALGPAGALWVAWPKRTSGVKTDLTENTVRDVALPMTGGSSTLWWFETTSTGPEPGTCSAPRISSSSLQRMSATAMGFRILYSTAPAPPRPAFAPRPLPERARSNRARGRPPV